MLSDDSPRPGAGVVYKNASSLMADGSRNFVHPADVDGRFHQRRKVVFAVLVLALAALPWVNIGGRPAIFLDVVDRQFFLFGNTYNAQDFWLVFFILSGVGYALIVMTALWGRVWCGYACPQTVFLEGIFRPLERLLEGPRSVRLRRNAGPASFDKLWRKGLKHTLYVLLAFLAAHIMVSYFVSLPALYDMVLSHPSEHPAAFAWAITLTGLMYLNFAWFREQLCLIVCPYGRLQSVLTDRDTLVIGYDDTRGEPRGKAKDPNAGDCVNCSRCVAVCPTGIDIRNGLQLDCVGCARCVDACDEVMVKLKRKPGLVRYDSLNGLEGKPKHSGRPRLYLYAGFGLAGLLAFYLAVSRSTNFEANLLRLRSLPYVVDGDQVRNSFELHLVNKRAGETVFSLEGQGDPRLEYTIAVPTLSLAPLKGVTIPVFVSFPRSMPAAERRASIRVRVQGHEGRTLSAPLLGPSNGE